MDRININPGGASSLQEAIAKQVDVALGHDKWRQAVDRVETDEETGAPVLVFTSGKRLVLPVPQGADVDLSDYPTREELQQAIPSLEGYARTDQIPDLTGYAPIKQVQALATQIAAMQDQIDALPDGGDQPTEPTIGAPRLTGSLPDVDEIQGDGTWTRDLKTAFTVEGDPSLDSVSWSISGAGSSVTADGIASGPLSALRSSVSVIATATNSQGQRQTAWSVTVRAPDSTDVTPPVLSAPHLVIDEMAGEITAGLDTSEQAEVRFLVVPLDSPAPTPAQFTENRDGSGSLALASAVLQSAGPGAVRAPISWTPDQRARVVAIATDAAGNSTRMEVGSLSNRTLIANFDSPDGTALVDYTADTGQQFTDIEGDLAISGGRVVNVNDTAGVARRRAFRVPLSSGYGRLSAVIRLSDDQSAKIGLGWGSFAAKVSGSEVNFSLYDSGAAHPRDSTFETIQRSTPSLQDALLEIDIRPDGHDTYLDGEIIRSSEFDSARDDRMAYFETSHQGDSFEEVIFDGDHYRAEVDGSIIMDRSNIPLGAIDTSQPISTGTADTWGIVSRDPLTLRAATDAGTARGGWPMRTESGVTYRVEWSADWTDGGSIIRVSPDGQMTPDGAVADSTDQSGLLEFAGTGGVMYVGPALAIGQGQEVQFERLSVAEAGAEQPQEPVTLGFAAQPTLDITGDAASYDAGTPAWPSGATGRTSSVTLADENGVLLETSGIDNPSGQTAAGTGLHTMTVTLGADNYEPVTRSVSARRPGEATLAMSSSPTEGEYEAMVDDSQPYDLLDADGNVIATIDPSTRAPQYLDDTMPVIEWDGTDYRVTYRPEVAWREDDWTLHKYGEWVVIDSDGEEDWVFGSTIESKAIDVVDYMPRDLGDHTGKDLLYRYRPFTRDGVAEPRDSNRLTIR